jgi:hypothetical protein
MISIRINTLTVTGAMIFIIALDAFVFRNSFGDARWANGKKVSRIRKWRLLFFGVALSSFAYAFIAAFQFIFFGNINGIQVHFGFPWLTIQGVPFFSILLTFATGALFTTLERFLDIKEKGDI